MKAVLIRNHELVWEDVPDPQLLEGEVLVEVQAAAVNRADLMQVDGNYPPPPGCPEWPGLEIAGVIREFGCVEVQAVGAGAANQAIKAVAVARGYLAPAGINLICIPAFANVIIDGEERTAIKLIVEPR